MKKKLFIFVLVIIAILVWWNAGPKLGNGSLKDFDPVRVSQNLLYAAKVDENTAPFLDTLANVDLEFLAKSLNEDSKTLSFWINIYNATTQIILKADSSIAEKHFYSDNLIEIGKTKISLDMIEHGILRKSKMKYGFGFLSKWFPSKFENMFVLKHEEDPRIHFALNCGATSCPPIAFYEPENIDDQLHMATKSYLEIESHYDREKNTVTVPAIMSWFRGDFGGKSGIIDFLKQYDIIPVDSEPNLEFSDFNWNLKLNNYLPDRTKM